MHLDPSFAISCGRTHFVCLNWSSESSPPTQSSLLSRSLPPFLALLTSYYRQARTHNLPLLLYTVGQKTICVSKDYSISTCAASAWLSSVLVPEEEGRRAVLVHTSLPRLLLPCALCCSLLSVIAPTMF